jgi:UDP-N-acetylglucosamine--N-acetylmuramyl-(pentapeptide) pyrophosphoryl-undecaprenol N-acetylglucosamine transferase
LSSLVRAKKILREFKPDAVIGTGGYASGPMLRVASKRGITTLIQEQNSFPGITNKLLSKRVDRICVAYDGMENYFPKEKILLTGNPVRQDILDLRGKKERGLETFGLSGDKRTLLVIGGSLGARTINESMALALDELVKNNIQVLWQTGKAFAEKGKELEKQYAGKGVKITEFISKMDHAYAVADAVVSRAGAISVSELCLVKKAAILVPSPNVAEDHQTKNAMALVNHHAALLVKDAEARQKLGAAIVQLMNDSREMEKLENNISKLAFGNSADVIASEVIQLINNKRSS